MAVPIDGAPGATASTAKLWLTAVAASQVLLSPAWVALMLQLPTLTNVKAPALVMVHTAVVLELKLTVRLELAVALSVGDVPKFWLLGWVKVMVCALRVSLVVVWVTAVAALPATSVNTTLKVKVPSFKPLTFKPLRVSVAVARVPVPDTAVPPALEVIE